MEKPLISVIIPIYNAEKTIEQCLDSVLSQTYRNIEIIAVNDGSTDKTAEKLSLYTDSRMKVTERENGGVSEARNTGLDRASGDYIAFVDADDYVTPDFLEYMYENLVRTGSDVASCGYTNIMVSGRVFEDVYPGFIEMKKKEALERMLYNDKFYITLWDKLYKRELFDGIRFDKGKLFEDTGTTYKVILRAEKIIYCGESKYFYRNVDDSITTSRFKKSKLDYVEMAENMASDVEKIYPDLKKGCDRKRLHALFSTLTQLAKSDERIPETEKYLMDKIKPLKRGVFFDKKVPKRDKAAILSLIFGYGGFLFCWKIYRKLKK